MARNNDRLGRQQPWRPQGWTRLALVLIVLAVGGYLSWQKQQRQRPAQRADDAPAIELPEQRRAETPAAPATSEPAGNGENSLPRDSAVLRDERSPPVASPSGAPRTVAPKTTQPASGRTTIANQTIRNLDGDVAYRGEIDVAPTIARIRAGRLLDFPNDGVTFQNRERRLPRKPAGYYKEYVHPTPGLRGPGPQRIVAGENGEFYYTPDHYRTFRRVDE